MQILNKHTKCDSALIEEGREEKRESDLIVAPHKKDKYQEGCTCFSKHIKLADISR